MKHFDLLVVGELNVDLIVDLSDQPIEFGQVERTVEDTRMVLGSSGAITACGAARLGLRVAMAGVVGTDGLGDFVLDELATRKVNVEHCRRRDDFRTGVTTVLNTRGGERAMLTYLGQIGRLSLADLPATTLGSARHVHVSSYFLQHALWGGMPDLLATVRAAGATSSIDPNYDPAETWDSGLTERLGTLDYLLLNDTEVCRLARSPTPRAAAESIARLGPTVVVKCGAAGAFLRGSAGSTVSVGAPSVTPLDTTGAGDSFNAGFLAGLLRGSTAQEALRLASACGALATTGIGGTAAQPGLAEAAACAAGLTLGG